MFSSSRKALVPLFVYLSLLFALAECHDVPLHLRDHANINMKRLMKKRSPFPDLADILPAPVVGAAAIPSLPPSVTPSAASAPATSSAASASRTETSATSSAASSGAVTSSATSSSASVSASASVTGSATTTTASTTATSTTASANETLNVANAPQASVSTVVPTITRIQSVEAASNTGNSAPISGAATNDNAKSTTLTVLIAVAASVGGVAILWTIFRKWKLSSSKKFDQRLNPIDWQPTTGDDDAIPTHRRVPSGSSFHSGSGHGHANSSRGADALDHDFTAIPNTTSAPIGGYADLARGPSPLPPMQEHLTRGPSFNRGYDNTVPIHNQAGYRDAYDYNGGNPRY